MVEYMPSLRKAHFYSSLYRWSQCEKLRDTKAAIQNLNDFLLYKIIQDIKVNFL